jgi:hypothetical protein
VTSNQRALRQVSVGALLLLLTGVPAAAQNYSFDARRIALGGTGGTPNIASDVPDDRRGYTSIVIPLGLVRVLTNVRVFFPNHDEFDFGRAVEFATRPMHVTFGGQQRSERRGRSFASDVSRGGVNRDLNVYRGFAAADSIFAEGLAAPNWGRTFVVKRNARGFQGFYAGTGPYLAARAEAQFDASLVNLLGADADGMKTSASVAERSISWRSQSRVAIGRASQCQVDRSRAWPVTASTSPRTSTTCTACGSTVCRRRSGWTPTWTASSRPTR